MSSILYNVIIAPIELIVEFVFELMFRVLGQRQTNQGFAVIGVSVAISFLTLPLYRRADAVQQKERDNQKRLSKWVNHIKKYFKGNERFMMLQTYYRENNYSPIQALNGSLSLLLEIPFFIAAYHFLSNLEVLNGASFGPINNLGMPDRLFEIRSFGINILPILMTLINCVSSAIYLKGFPIKDKIQTYGMALIFLILLYNSPSGLVVYWTCNNIFSLVKNIFYKVKNPRKVFDYLIAGLGTIFTIAVFASGILNSKKKIIAIFLFMIITYIPGVLSILSRKKVITIKQRKDYEPNSLIYFSGIFITILLGILIPSTVISSSPAEFVDKNNYQNPLHYLLYTLSYSAGFFILWPTVIFNITNSKTKKVLSFLFYITSSVFIVNFLFFGKKHGLLSPFLVFENGINFSFNESALNVLSICLLLVLCFFTFRYTKVLKFIYIAMTISLLGVSIKNIHHTQKLLSDMAYIKNNDASKNTVRKIIPLSKKGKNVIVFMLDRAFGGYIPYLFEEKPFLKEQFSGFTYYPNSVSFGFCTNFGSPALFGGYEYTITEMNKRNDELLVTKHNEALKVMPWIFDKAGYEVTVCDPPYAGYKWVPDLSIFDDNKNINTYVTMGNIKNEGIIDPEFIIKKLQSNNRNFYFYSLVKVLPTYLAKILYDNGHYFDSKYIEYNNVSYEAYSVLSLLPELTKITDEQIDTFLSIDNDTAHEPCVYQLPDYTFSTSPVNNSDYNNIAAGKLVMNKETQIIHYHANMAALLQLGKWFDYLRDNNVYDNTRIIIVADHGVEINQFDFMHLKHPEINVERCNPLFMFKDFNSKEFQTSNEFMTIADVPTLATKELIKNPVNPFTGKEITNIEKYLHPQIITSSFKPDVTVNNGTTFDTSDGHFYSVHDNIFDENNWELIE